MGTLNRLSQWYRNAKGNRWFRYFTVFCRVALALGFIPSGIVKISGERFTALPGNHPLGQYFDALHLTGFYYTFIGIAQLATALLLLIPRTALLGAILYFPVILNICILTYAVRFEGTRITTLMTLASLYLLVWDYDRLKHILPFSKQPPAAPISNNKFPTIFFGCVFVAVASVIAINQFMFNIRPGNSQIECTNGCPGNDNPAACNVFCDCIYNHGKPLDTCLDEYEQAKVESSGL
jgi:uncharacterized membrane protein YphA (DoxX/SURF4 family)